MSGAQHWLGLCVLLSDVVFAVLVGRVVIVCTMLNLYSAAGVSCRGAAVVMLFPAVIARSIDSR